MWVGEKYIEIYDHKQIAFPLTPPPPPPSTLSPAPTPHVQGGSDISGTHSKLQCHIKKILFWTIILPQTVSAVFRSINKNKNTHSSKDKSKGSYKSRDSLQTLRRTYHERDAELAQGEPYGGVIWGSLASQVAWLQAFWLFRMWRLWIMGQSKVSQQMQGSDPEDEGGDGVLCQGHPGEGLHKLQVQDRGYPYSWRQFYWINLFSICISAIFFTSIKSDEFQLCCAIWKKEEKNSGFIAATLYTTFTSTFFFPIQKVNTTTFFPVSF